MISTHQIRTTRTLILCACISFLVSGCGDGSDDGGSSNTKVVPCNPVTFFVTIGLACIVPISDNTAPLPEPQRTPPLDVAASSPLISMEAYDVEPNNEITMANAVTFPAPLSTTQSVGFHVNGNYGDLSDGVDTFAMVANRTRTFLFQLCASSAGEDCNQISPDGRLDISIAYLNVYDQGGMLLTTSQANTIDGNLLRMQVDAGVLYYVMIVAENTDNRVQNYYLRAYESTTET